MPDTDPRRLRVFLCHASQDKPAVRELCQQLAAEGWIEPWLDEEKLLPGQEWDLEIEKAVESADVVLVCLSNRSVDKEGYVQKELRFVLNIAEQKPEGTIFVIPLKLEECPVPRRLRSWQWVNYFPKNNRGWAYTRLLDSLKARAEKLGISTVRPSEGNVIQEAETRGGEKAGAEEKARHEDEAGTGPASLLPRSRTKSASPRWLVQALMAGGVLALFFACGWGINCLINNWPDGPATPAATFPAVITLATQVSDRDGMTLVYVPAGEFIMGFDADDALAECLKFRSDCQRDWFANEEPTHTVSLDAYWIDQTEVTNGMYALCAQAGACDPPDQLTSDTRDSYYGNPEFDDYPVIHVTWYDARDYCEWAGRRLPTEAEWEKAAAWDESRQEKLIYPWGNSIDCSFANYWGVDGPCAGGDTTKVGSYPSGASPYGVLDMAGNVWEWVSSLYKPYPYTATDGREDLSAGGERVLRGGSWSYNVEYSRSSVRGGIDPSASTNDDLGFRCGMDARP